MTYPDGIDALVNVNAGDTLAAGGHAARHNSVNTALVEIKNMLGPSPAGKIMQIVRATDSTLRTTTSTSYVDANLSVTITPQKSDSAVLLVANLFVQTAGSENAILRITDSNNNEISGAEFSQSGTINFTLNANSFFTAMPTLIGRATPATTSAVTYKVRYQSGSGGIISLGNNFNTAQLYAIEVSA